MSVPGSPSPNSDDESIPEDVEYLTGYDDERYAFRCSRGPSPRLQEYDFDEEKPRYRPRYASPKRDMQGQRIPSRSPSVSPPRRGRAPSSWESTPELPGPARTPTPEDVPRRGRGGCSWREPTYPSSTSTPPLSGSPVRMPGWETEYDSDTSGYF